MQNAPYLIASGILLTKSLSRELVNSAICIVVVWLFIGIAIIVELRSATLRAKELNLPPKAVKKVWVKFVDYSYLLAVMLMVDIIIMVMDVEQGYGKCYAFLTTAIGCLLREAVSMVKNYRAYNSPAADIPKLLKRLSKLSLHDRQELLRELSSVVSGEEEKKE